MKRVQEKENRKKGKGGKTKINRSFADDDIEEHSFSFPLFHFSSFPLLHSSELQMAQSFWPGFVAAV